ncbi:MAG: nicotinate phosphoribosyltransferase [Dehalococcoidia bacterium]|nr:nicotinate phosphoribosyltransferase [Dehalococcoidia bacterium]
MRANDGIAEAQSPSGDDGLALFTDLYQLTMLQAYFEEGMTERAVFSLFVRRLPRNRNFLVACGLDTVLDYLESLRFTQQDLDYLGTLKIFSDRFLAWLANFRFTGDVHAVREGTPVFANEPILEVEAPLPEAQLIETFVLNQVQIQTMLASKAHRVVTAARGRSVIDFGARRMHGIDAALNAARAFRIAGVNATSNVLAGKRFGIPVAGTLAHSYIQAHGDESAAFRAFADLYPDTVLLIDTYDTLKGVEKVIELANDLGDDFKIRAVRLDSGDLLDLSRRVRDLLDQAGLHSVQIIASSSLDEYEIDTLISSGAPIDGFGVGTAMGVSADAPYLDIVYKLTSYAGEGRVKLATDKPVLPGRKQIFRMSDGECDTEDIIARADEDLPGRPLLEQAMRDGKRLVSSTHDLDETRRYAAEQIARLPQSVRSLPEADPPYPVEVSPKLNAYHEEVIRQTASRSLETRVDSVE